MTATLSVRVIGNPAPQGSKSAFVDATGRARLLEGRTTGQRTKHGAWRAAVFAAFIEQYGPASTPIAEPVAVTVVFWMPRPRTGPNSKPSVILHAVNPDLDKLCRSTLDAIVSSGHLADDRYIVRLSAMKRYADERPPGASIIVRPVGHHIVGTTEDGDPCPG